MDEESLCDEAGIETSGDDADFNIEIESTSTSQLHVYEDEYQYEVLSISDIVAFMTECINAVNTVIHIPSPTIRILLNHYNWDKEKLVEHFFDRDQEALFREANVVNPLASHKSTIAIATVNNSSSATINTNMTGGGNKKGILTNKNTIGKNVVAPPQLKMKLSRNVLQSSEECSICFASCLPEQMAGLECGHKFCLQCWNEYLTTKIMEEGVGQTIACAAHKCPILVDDQTVMTLVRDARVKTKYQHLITNSFVECNRLMRWCPAPDCNYAVRVAYVDAKPVACACGHVFCFACGENWHDPVKCNLLKKWMKKFDDDSETSNWISANTKECPKCNATIEKDGGCNHMVCKNQNCKADFCWVCLGSWEPHGSSWYHCNRYDESEAKAARDAQDRSRAALQRYLFYCNRYMNHMQSLKFEHKLYSAVKDKMEEMQQQNMSWIEVQFLRKAVDTLCKCRQTLMYTYVFAYYLEKNNQSVIFEDNQKDLESATEILSEYLERDITSENIVDIKQKVQDKYRYCDGRRKALLDHVHEGYEKDWWVCNNL